MPFWLWHQTSSCRSRGPSRSHGPSQPAALEGTPFYNEQLATQYTEFNVDKANEYLDKVLPDKNADGIRLRPDGKPLEITIEYCAA